MTQSLYVSAMIGPVALDVHDVLLALVVSSCSAVALVVVTSLEQQLALDVVTSLEQQCDAGTTRLDLPSRISPQAASRHSSKKSCQQKRLA
ncbi:TPA: hypothetical protein ACH3X1_016243 [Trebouxia sp. C0004]